MTPAKLRTLTSSSSACKWRKHPRIRPPPIFSRTSKATSSKDSALSTLSSGLPSYCSLCWVQVLQTIFYLGIYCTILCLFTFAAWDHLWMHEQQDYLSPRNIWDRKRFRNQLVVQRHRKDVSNFDRQFTSEGTELTPTDKLFMMNLDQVGQQTCHHFQICHHFHCCGNYRHRSTRI